MVTAHNSSTYEKQPILGAIGVGCFHFALRSRASERIAHKDYRKQIKATLQSLPAVGEVVIDSNPLMDDSDLSIPENLLNIRDAMGCFPPLGYNTRVKFTLFIPHRVQEDLCNIPGRKLNTLTEHFRVQILGSFRGLPVAFIEPQAPTGIPDPSAAVFVVREFLEKQMTQANSGNLMFQFVGPSPFHADIYMFDSSAQDMQAESPFTVTHVPQAGYDKIFIGMNLKKFDSRDDAIDSLLEAAIDELGLFYDILQDKQVRLTEWHLIAESVQALANLLRSRGLLSPITRLYRSSTLINEITMSLCEFQATCIERTQSTREHYSEIYGPDRECPFFKPFIDKELQQDQSYPVRELTELVRFAESRRTVAFQVLVNILVGILGGIAGAITTLLLKS